MRAGSFSKPASCSGFSEEVFAAGDSGAVGPSFGSLFPALLSLLELLSFFSFPFSAVGRVAGFRLRAGAAEAETVERASRSRRIFTKKGRGDAEGPTEHLHTSLHNKGRNRTPLPCLSKNETSREKASTLDTYRFAATFGPSHSGKGRCSSAVEQRIRNALVGGSIPPTGSR